MNIETGREFSLTNPQDDPHLYARPPAGFDYSYDGTLVGVPKRQTPVQTAKISPAQIRTVLQHGKFLPNARGPGKVTFCDVCQKRDLRQSIAYQDLDICLDCAQKY